MAENIYLLLENGQYFEGKSFGADLQENGVIGEVVFTTGMTGYLETITDPSYFGQIVVQTFPLMGNYGIIPEDFESDKPYLFAYICREWCQTPSNFRGKGDLDAFFKEKNIPAVYDVDTRYLTKVIREQGVMNGVLLTKKPSEEKEKELLSRLKAYKITDAVKNVTEHIEPEFSCEDPVMNIGLWDFGEKTNIVRELVKRGAKVTSVCPNASFEEIKAMNLDGLMLSNGPGDPHDNPEVIENLKQLIKDEKLPIFGICLGHQLLALAHGAEVIKLKYGHHGANQPIKDLQRDHIFMTSQNHNYAVDQSTLPKGVTQTFINLNDGSNEGVSYDGFNQSSVQFHPEACAGPLDSEMLFDRFIAQVKDYQGQKGE